MSKQFSRTYFIFISLAFLRGFSSCSNMCQDNWHSKHLIQDFYLEWVGNLKTQEVTLGSWNCGVGGNLPITDGTVFAVGFDSSFIIIKSHPDKSGEIRKRLFVDTNSRGDYSFATSNDTIYIDKEYSRERIYQQNGKWYHTSKDWSGQVDSLYLNKERTTYYIIDIRNYSEGKDYQHEKTSKYEDEGDFTEARKKLGVDKELDFSYVNKDLQ